MIRNDLTKEIICKTIDEVYEKIEDWEESNITFKSLQEYMDSEFEASEWE